MSEIKPQHSEELTPVEFNPADDRTAVSFHPHAWDVIRDSNEKKKVKKRVPRRPKRLTSKNK